MGWLKLKEYGLKEAYIRKLMKEFGAYSDMFIASNFNLFSDKFKSTLEKVDKVDVSRILETHNKSSVRIISAKDNEYPNYKTFNLKKGDTIKLEIKSDSSFLFNHLYYNKEFGNIQISSIDNYIGKITTNLDYKDKIFIPFPDDSFDVQGFLISEKDTIFFNRLSMEHYNNYEYRIFYKKMK